MKIHTSLLKGSAVLLVSFFLFTLFNFLYRLVMARMLSLEEFGILATLSTIISLLGIFADPIQTTLTKYCAKESDDGKLKNISRRMLKKLNYFSLWAFLSFLVFSVILSIVLKITLPLIALTSFYIFYFFSAPVFRGIIQGRKKFVSLGVVILIDAVLTLIFSFFLVYFGFGVYGAIIGPLIGGYSSLGVAYLQTRYIFKNKEKEQKEISLTEYSKPTFFLMFAMFLFYSLDILIARIVFSSELAGAYAVSSMAAKTIFLASVPITKAMLPYAVEKDTSKKDPESLLKNALSLTLILIIFSLSAVYFFPDLIIRFVAGRYIPESISILFYLSISTSLMALSNLAVIYRLSRKKVSGYYHLVLPIMLEVFLLFYFSGNLLEYSIALITATTIFLCSVIFLIKE
jgi:O-antigen/teichoic acid export membrane protein